MSREDVLARIRAALAAAPTAARAPAAEALAATVSEAEALVPAHGVPPEPSNRAPHGPAGAPAGDPVALFVERSHQVGVKVERVASIAAAAVRVATICAGRGVRVAAAWHDHDLAEVLSAVRGAGVAVLPADASPAEVAAADAGITGADWGIAESGTLVLASRPGRPRLASLLPAVHVAVLRADRILLDLAALFARTAGMPSALTFVSGPSRSADIGFTPVLGAHGPTEVVVLVVEG
ncbi:MAG: lactate utilization protein [Armatimonadota bacterium]|nr:lactate utilization protein [Armatimonadota bacterium]MDR7512534.1 lactate utilization protein [Armatimonadota bacterium]